MKPHGENNSESRYHKLAIHAAAVAVCFILNNLEYQAGECEKYNHEQENN